MGKEMFGTKKQRQAWWATLSPEEKQKCIAEWMAKAKEKKRIAQEYRDMEQFKEKAG